MTRLAVADATRPPPSARWEVSDLELRRDGPSFTFDTLAALQREGLSPLQMFFIIGADAFAEIATWHRYPDVLDAAHFAVVVTPGDNARPAPRAAARAWRRMTAPSAAVTAATTRIILIEAETPERVVDRDPSSRGAGESVDGLVTPAVAAYIAQHSLYRH